MSSTKTHKSLQYNFITESEIQVFGNHKQYVNILFVNNWESEVLCIERLHSRDYEVLFLNDFIKEQHKNISFNLRNIYVRKFCSIEQREITNSKYIYESLLKIINESKSRSKKLVIVTYAVLPEYCNIVMILNNLNSKYGININVICSRVDELPYAYELLCSSISQYTDISYILDSIMLGNEIVSKVENEYDIIVTSASIRKLFTYNLSQFLNAADFNNTLKKFFTNPDGSLTESITLRLRLLDLMKMNNASIVIAPDPESVNNAVDKMKYINDSETNSNEVNIVRRNDVIDMMFEGVNLDEDVW